METNFYKHECGLYIKDGHKWQIDLYGFDPKGMGDIIYNTMRKIIDENDRSNWAYDALDICSNLLRIGIRWPDQLGTCYDNLYIACNGVDFYASKLYKWLGGRGKQLYRSQKSETRDSYIYYFAACIVLDRQDYIHVVTIPWYLFSPTTWAWLYYIKTGNGLRLYEWLEGPEPEKDYVKLLQEYRRLAVKKMKA